MTDTHVPHRFVLLDGIRGLAAVAIVHRHAEVFFGRPEASSYLAVDLFFALSGFVLAHAYGERLANGQIKPLNFMKARFLRLYPLYGLALLLMTAFFVCLYFLDLPTPIDDLHRKIQPAELGFALVTGLLFLPAPFTLTLNGALFLVSPAWSLFNELVVNIAYALKGARAQVKTIGVILALSACVLIIATIHSGKLHLGFRWHEMYAGMGRVFFSFFAGVLIYRFRSQTIKTRPALAVMCLSAVALVLFLPVTDEIRPIFDVVIVLLVWPILLSVSASIEAGGWLDRVSNFLGTASYAVYVLHIPLLAWTLFLVPRAGDAGWAIPAGLTFIVATVFISYALTVYFDQPLQIRMKKRLKASSVSRVHQAARI